jgi:hypothetical protein
MCTLNVVDIVLTVVLALNFASECLADGLARQSMLGY